MTDEPPCLGAVYGIPPRPSKDAAERAWCNAFATRLVEITKGAFTHEEGFEMARAGEIDLTESAADVADDMLTYLDNDEP
jgi:hypothetical protein